MLQSSLEMDQVLRRAIAAAQANDHSTAYHLLKQVLTYQPRNEQAWLWLSGVVKSDAERRYCLEQVLMRNPSHTAVQRGLEMLSNVLPVSPFAQATASQDTASAQHVLGVLQTPPEPVATASVEPVLKPPAPLFEESLAKAGITKEELCHYIEVELAREDDIEVVVRTLSQRFSIAWEDLEPLVEEVNASSSRRIAVRRSPIVIGIGILTLLLGITIIVFTGSVMGLDIAGLSDHDPNRKERAVVLRSMAVGIFLVISALVSIGYNIWQMIKK